jgi:hypothetical protein
VATESAVGEIGPGDRRSGGGGTKIGRGDIDRGEGMESRSIRGRGDGVARSIGSGGTESRDRWGRRQWWI